MSHYVPLRKRTQASEDRRAHCRDRKPHQACTRHRLSAGRPVPASGWRLTAGWAVNDGAETLSVRPSHLSRQLQRVQKVRIDSAAKTQRGIASAIISRTKPSTHVNWVNKTG